MSAGVNNFFTKCRSVSSSLCHIIITILPLLFLQIVMSGCVSDNVNDEGVISTYQESLVQTGPQERTGTEGLEPLIPLSDPRLPDLKEIKDRTGKTTINLTLDNVVVRTMANSPEITVVSFDPSIAKENIAVEASEFDFTAFGQFGYEKNDVLSNDISESGQSDESVWEAGISRKVLPVLNGVSPMP
jgi:hypothetical protein